MGVGIRENFGEQFRSKFEIQGRVVVSVLSGCTSGELRTLSQMNRIDIVSTTE